MQTAIRKRYTDGFTLTEQDIRKFHQLLQDAAVKISGPGQSTSNIYVRTADGTIAEIKNIEELLSLDNSGEKRIDYVRLAIKSKQREEEEYPDPTAEYWSAEVRFVRPEDNYERGTSMQIDVVGSSRDWVVLTAASLTERVRLIRHNSMTKALAQPYVPILVLMAALAIGFVLFSLYFRSPPPYEHLEALYKAGKVSNPIEAIIIIERSRAGKSLEIIFFGMLSLLAMAAAVSAALPRVARWLWESHVFLWGDYVAIHRRKRNSANVFWTVVVLGLLVGVLSTYLSKAIGI